VGLNCTDSGMEEPAAIVYGRAWGATEKPMPETLTIDTETDVVPVFWIARPSDLFVPVVMLPKLRDVGVAATGDGVVDVDEIPVPAKGTEP